MNSRAFWLMVACLCMAAIVAIMVYVDLYRWIRLAFSAFRL